MYRFGGLSHTIERLEELFLRDRINFFWPFSFARGQTKTACPPNPPAGGARGKEKDGYPKSVNTWASRHPSPRHRVGELVCRLNSVGTPNDSGSVIAN